MILFWLGLAVVQQLIVNDFNLRIKSGWANGKRLSYLVSVLFSIPAKSGWAIGCPNCQPSSGAPDNTVVTILELKFSLWVIV